MFTVTYNFLIGISGVGKSETALQLFKRYKRNNRDLSFLERTFNTDSVAALINDLTDFNQEKDLRMQTLAQLQRRENLGDIFEELFEVLNTKFPNHVKCQTFDDACQSTSIVKHINDYVCDTMDGALYTKWKIVITAQDDSVAAWVDGCDWLNERNFFHVSAFDSNQTSEYLQNVRELSPDLQQSLHDKLGGLPVALQVAREYLKQNHVCRLNCAKFFF